MASSTAAGVDLVALGLVPEKPKRSAAAKGSYYKNRTKEWLERQGYAVAYLERMMWIRRGGQAPCGVCGRPDLFPTKQDQFGADLLAIKTDGASGNDPLIVFVQVKLGADQLNAARREFARHPFPRIAVRWVVIWEPRAREPRIVDCSADTVESLGPVRGRRKAEGTLF